VNINLNNIKLIHAILLFSCLLPFWEYGFFQLLRFISMLLFGLYAFKEYEAGNMSKVWIYVALAILFQPLVSFSLGRLLWNVVDLVVGVWLICNKK